MGFDDGSAVMKLKRNVIYKYESEKEDYIIFMYYLGEEKGEYKFRIILDTDKRKDVLCYKKDSIAWIQNSDHLEKIQVSSADEVRLEML